MEASTTPERAEAAADRLLTLMPEAGHIVHMPAHIYYRVGRYADAARVNELAAKVDEDYIAACKAQGFYPAGYYGHNIHFLWTSAEMQGRYQTAIDAARRLVKAVDAGERSPSSCRRANSTSSRRWPPLLRFGKWNEVLAEPAPPKALTLDTAVWTYARGFAHANTGDLDAARADRDEAGGAGAGGLLALRAVRRARLPMTELALALLDGEIARVSGDLPGAVAQFRKPPRTGSSRCPTPSRPTGISRSAISWARRSCRPGSRPRPRRSTATA